MRSSARAMVLSLAAVLAVCFGSIACDSQRNHDFKGQLPRALGASPFQPGTSSYYLGLQDVSIYLGPESIHKNVVQVETSATPESTFIFQRWRIAKSRLSPGDNSFDLSNKA